MTSPNPITNRMLSKAIGKAIHRPAILPVPRVAVRLMLGEFADEALLASQRTLPRGLQQAGFVFKNVEIESTLRALLG